MPALVVEVAVFRDSEHQIPYRGRAGSEVVKFREAAPEEGEGESEKKPPTGLSGLVRDPTRSNVNRRSRVFSRARVA